MGRIRTITPDLRARYQYGQLKATQIKRDKYKPKLKKALAIFEKTGAIEAVMKEFGYTKDGCYKMIRKAKELREKREL